MKYDIYNDFRFSTPFHKKSSHHFKDLRKLNLTTNFNVNLTSLTGGVMNLAFNTLFITPPKNEIRLTSKFVRSFTLCRSLK